MSALSALGSVAYYFGALRSPARSWSGGFWDPQQMMWFLGWAAHALTHGDNPFTSTYLLYPHGLNLMWNTSILLSGFVLAPVTVLASPMVSYNVLLTITPVLASATAFLLFRRHVRSNVAAVVGGLFFGFCPFVMIQAPGHPHLSQVAIVPLLFLLLDELVVRQRWRWWVTGGLVGLGGAAQLLVGEEVLTMTALAGVVAVIALVALHPRAIRTKARYAGRGLGAASVAFVALAGYPLAVQFWGPRRAPNSHQPGTFVTDLANFVQPSGQRLHLDLLRMPLSFTGNASEWTGYVGIPLLILIGWTVARYLRRRSWVPVLLIVMLVVALLSLGPHLHVDGRSVLPMPWAILQHVPLLSNVLPSRLSMVVELCVAAMVAVFVDNLRTSRRLGWTVIGGVLVIAAAVTWIPKPDTVTTSAVPRFFTTRARSVIPAGSVALVAPYIDATTTENPMVWQAASGMRFRLVDGSVIVPGPHDGPTTVASTTLTALQERTVALTPALRVSFLDYLHRRDVHEVIVGPGPGERRDVAFFRALFRSAPDLHDGSVSLWWVPRSH